MATEQLTAEQIAESLKDLDRGDLQDLAESYQEIERQLISDGPKTPDELWQWIKANLGLEIPRTPVCEGHDSPFDFLKKAYFQEYPAILGMGSRSGGKTFMVALLHWLNSTFRPGIESCTFGATENQSLRCYSHLKGWIYDENGNKAVGIKSSVMRETQWVTGSKVEVLAGTPEAVNGPHPQIVHGDEVELMRNDTWEESRNMAISKTIPPGHPNNPTDEPIVYQSQEILTSTRKGLKGRMQELIDGIDEAVKAGKVPSYHLVIWCIFEIAQEVPSCQKAPEHKRQARLTELGRDPEELCHCEQYMKGKWPHSGDPRLLTEVCRGRLFRSRGFLPYEDVVQKFQQNSIHTWEAQQECSKPETEHNYLQNYAEEIVGIREYEPRPEFGRIYNSTDWGGTNPHASNWYQLLSQPIEVLDFYYEPKVLIKGSIVVFGEIYHAESGVNALARMIKAKEAQWKQLYPGWKVSGRFADPQGKAHRKDFKDEYGLPTTWHTTRDFDVQVEWLVGEIWEEDLLFVDIGECPNFSDEAQSWQRDPNNPDKELDEHNHCMANLRYATANIRALTKKHSKGTDKPQAHGRLRTAHVVKDTRDRLKGGPIRVTGDTVRDEFHKRLGGPGGY